MKDFFKSELKKEKSNIFKEKKNSKIKIPKKIKDILLLAGGTILVAEAVDIIN